MQWYYWVGISLLALILIVIISRMINKSDSSGSLENRAKGAVGKIGACCKKIFGKFGGGA